MGINEIIFQLIWRLKIHLSPRVLRIYPSSLCSLTLILGEKGKKQSLGLKKHCYHKQTNNPVRVVSRPLTRPNDLGLFKPLNLGWRWNNAVDEDGRWHIAGLQWWQLIMDLLWRLCDLCLWKYLEIYTLINKLPIIFISWCSYISNGLGVFICLCLSTHQPNASSSQLPAVFSLNCRKHTTITFQLNL